MAASRPTFVLILIMSLLALLTLSSRSSPSWKTSLRALDVPYYRAFSQTNLKLNKNDYFSLPSGDKIPVIALGTWKANPGEVGRAVSTALKAGYRHIDGAWAYRWAETFVVWVGFLGLMRVICIEMKQRWVRRSKLAALPAKIFG